MTPEEELADVELRLEQVRRMPARTYAGWKPALAGACAGAALAAPALWALWLLWRIAAKVGALG